MQPIPDEKELVMTTTNQFAAHVGGGADEFLDFQELIYAFIRGSYPGRRTLLPVR